MKNGRRIKKKKIGKKTHIANFGYLEFTFYFIFSNFMYISLVLYKQLTSTKYMHICEMSDRFRGPSANLSTIMIIMSKATSILQNNHIQQMQIVNHQPPDGHVNYLGTY